MSAPTIAPAFSGRPAGVPAAWAPTFHAADLDVAARLPHADDGLPRSRPTSVGRLPNGAPRPGYGPDDPTRSPKVPFRGGRRQGPKDQEGIDDNLAVLASAWDPATYEVAALLPPRPPGMPGTPPAHPDWVFVLWIKAMDSLHSSRRVHFALAGDGLLWPAVLRHARTRLGDEAVDAYVAKGLGPPRRHHFNTWLRRVKDLPDDVQEPFWAGQRAQNRATAREDGALDPDARGGVTHLDNTNVVGADGTVAKSPTRNIDPEWVDTTTGQVFARRVDDAARYCYEGGQDTPTRVHGVPIDRLSVRGTGGWHSNTILDTDHILREDGGEMAKTMQMFRRLRAEEPGARGLVTDKIMRGKDSDALLGLGAVPFSYVRAGTRHPNDAEDPDQADADTPVLNFRHFPAKAGGILTRDHEHGTCRHTIAAEDGWGVEERRTSRGPKTRTRLAHKPVSRLRPDGHTDWYAEVFVPCPHGVERRHDATGTLTTGHVHRVNARQCPEYDKAGFNVGEYFRLVRLGDPVFDRVVPGRNNTEQHHSRGDENYYRRRIPAWGVARQRWILRLMDAGYNSVTRWIAAGRPPLNQ